MIWDVKVSSIVESFNYETLINVALIMDAMPSNMHLVHELHSKTSIFDGQLLIDVEKVLLDLLTSLIRNIDDNIATWWGAHY